VNFAAGSRVSAGLLGFVGGALGLGLGFILLLLGGVMAILHASNGASVGVTGAIVILFAAWAVAVASLFFLHRDRPAIGLTAVSIAGIIWAFARIDAWGLALIPVLPLAGAVILGAIGLDRSEPSGG